MSDDLASKQALAMERLRERFRATIGNTLDAFRQLGRQLADTPDSTELLDALRRELHRVHGTAGSYGFMEASRIAGKLEARSVDWARDPSLERSARANIVANLVVALEGAFHDGVGKDSLETSMQRTVVAAGLTAAQLAVIAPDAALRGYRLAALAPAQVDSDALHALHPVAIIAASEEAPALCALAERTGILLVAVGDASTDTATLFAGGIEFRALDRGAGELLDLVDKREREAGMGGTTVVALDDDPAILDLVREVLARPGLEVVAINDANALIPTLETSNACLLLMDINMPGWTGVEITRILRADDRYQDLPIVLLSAETDVESRNKALQYGADEFVAKPIAPTELRSRIADRLDRLRLRRLSNGMNPVTGFPFGPRAAREVAQAFAQGPGDPMTVVLVRPAIDANASFESGIWSREIRRLTRPLKSITRYVGHHEGDALLMLLSATSAEAAERLEAATVSAAPTAPVWYAGIVALDEAPSRDAETVQRCAAEALDVAVSRALRVHKWHADEATIAPDVIVVEDDPALSDMLQYALRASGFTYRAFNNGRHALDFLLVAKTQARRPIVLLDVDLPGLDGYSLHEQLSVDRAGDFAVVFVTVHGAETDQLRALKGGAIDFVQKPINLRILMAKMKSWAAVTWTTGRT